MKKRKKKNQNQAPKPATFAHQPFKGLSLPESQQEEPAALSPPLSKRVAEEESPPIDDDALLEAAMSGVMPMASDKELVTKKAVPRPMLIEADEDALVMQYLDELVHGDADFSFADTSEFIEAAHSGLDRRLLRRLRRGEFSCQAHLDLHGLNREQARADVGAFIRKCVLESKKCVLIVHGRGLGSKDNIPVLKTKLAAWLTRGSIGKKVLAYTSARPYDGGTGAVYVLLRTP